MANTTNTTSYLDPPSLIGRQNNDGTISLTPLELKRLNDFNYAVSKMIQGGLNLANLNADTNQVFTDIEGNVTTLQTTAAGLQSSVANADGKATTALQTADGLSVSVSNLSGEVSTVSATINGLNVTTSGGTTYISGDHIKTGTIEGVDFISSNGAYMPIIEIQSGSVLFGQDHGGFKGDLSFNVSDNLVWLRSYGSVPLKILSGTNMSIDSNGTIYIGASSGYSGNVNIGQSGGTINLNGTVTVNGVPYAPAGG